MANDVVELDPLPRAARKPPSVLGRMTLHKIARDGRMDSLNTFLERCDHGSRERRQLDALDKDGFAALHYAARFNRVAITEKLLEAKCDPRVRSKDGLAPLHYAARHLPQSGDTGTRATDLESANRQVIRILLEAERKIGGDILQCTLFSDNYAQEITPLHMACSWGNVPAVQELISFIEKNSPGKVNMRDKNGDTPLHEACVCGNIEIVEKLLKNGAQVDAENRDKEMPLHRACKKGFVEIVKEILLQMANPLLIEAVDNRRNAPLHLAVESGDLETVKALFDHEANPTVENEAKVLPIHLAAGQGCTRIAKELLDRDCSCIDKPDDQQHTPLHYAARANEVEMIEYLIFMKCDKEKKDNDSMSPLLLSAVWGKAKAVQALVASGCDVNTTDKEGKSAVFWAAQEGHVDVLRVLLNHDKGVQLCSLTELHHNTPLHIAAEMGRAQALELLFTHLEKAEQLQHSSHSGSVQEANKGKVSRPSLKHLVCTNDENKIPLHLAAMYGHLQVVRFLVHKYRSSLTDKDENGNTPLHLAALHGRTEVVNFLIDEGAEVAAMNADMRTPLAQAADNGHAEIISMLIKADAMLETTDSSAKTPLFLACRSGHLDAATELMYNGANVRAEDDTKMNCLDAAVENGHENVALAIINSDQWEEALRHADQDEQMTPFRRMIRQMPTVAKVVLDRCMRQNVTKDRSTQKKTHNRTVEFNFEFLDDYKMFLKLHPKQSSDDEEMKSRLPKTHSARSSLKDKEENQGFIAQCGPEVFLPKYHPLALMVSHSCTDLLKHPVVASLLDYKWKRYGKALFLFNLFTYIIYLFCLTTYALLLPHPGHRFCHEFSVSQSVASLPVNGTVCPHESASANHSDVFNMDPTVPLGTPKNVALICSAVIVIISATARLFVKLFQFWKTRYRYFLHFENYIELAAYLSSVFFVSDFGANCWCPTNWQWQLGAFGVFLAWINLILFLKRVPYLDIYVLMFNSILYTFLKFALIAFLFVVAFCLAFYMILYKALDNTTLVANTSPFRSVPLSFVKTLVMTTGEFEYDIIFGQNCECSSLSISFPEAGYFLWIVFLVVMPILLNDVLVGLVVGDTKAILDQVQLKRVALQIDLTLKTEELLPNCIRHRFVVQTRYVVFKERLGHWARFVETFRGAECWDSVDNIRKFTQREVSSHELQSQTEQLSRDVSKLRSELMEKNKQMEQLLERTSHMEQLLEKNNDIEKLLVLMANKQGIKWKTGMEESLPLDDQV